MAVYLNLGFGRIPDFNGLGLSPGDSLGDKVDVYWPCETRWYRGQVVGLDSGGVYWIKFDGFDEHARILRSYLRQVK